jgi:hypothetical protein
VVVVAILASSVIFAAAYAVDGWAAIDDTWVGLAVAASLLGGLVAAFVAFGLSVMASMRHERWRLLWLPRLLFPVLVGFLVLGELFWWE